MESRSAETALRNLTNLRRMAKKPSTLPKREYGPLRKRTSPGEKIIEAAKEKGDKKRQWMVHSTKHLPPSHFIANRVLGVHKLVHGQKHRPSSRPGVHTILSAYNRGKMRDGIASHKQAFANFVPR